MPTIHQLSKASELPRSARIALYGAGSAGQGLRSFLEEERPDLEFSFFVDAVVVGPIQNLAVIRPAELPARARAFDVLVITSAFLFEIEEELERLGVGEYWVCDRHFFEYAIYCVSDRCGSPGEITRVPSYASAGSHARQVYGKPINFLPPARDLNADGGIERFVLDGYLPNQPFITKQTRVTAFGSCFAGHIRKHLAAHGYRLTGEADGQSQNSQKPEAGRYYDKAHLFYRHSDFENSFVIREQLEWALEGREFGEKLWYDRNHQACSYGDESRDATRRLLQMTDVFIFTFGLAEIWQNVETSEVFWGSIPNDAIDPRRHQFRLSTVTENVENIERICELVRKHVTGATVILTLSPVPLAGTWRDIPCLSANTVSKATLRVAIDQVWLRHRDDGFLYYWPSYEIVREATPSPFIGDNRHVREDVINDMMERFSHYFLADGNLPPTTPVRRMPMSATVPE